MNAVTSDCIYNRLYNNILDGDWFFAHLFDNHARINGFFLYVPNSFWTYGKRQASDVFAQKKFSKDSFLISKFVIDTID